MQKKPEAYKKIEKWWLALVILFYVLYNLPGVPQYGDAKSAILHGALTIIPLWVITYAGMIILHRQRRLNNTPDDSEQRVGSEKEGN